MRYRGCRLALYRRAIDYVERHCDESVIGQLARLARHDQFGDHRMSSAVAHVITLFKGKLRDSDAGDSFVNLLSPIIDHTIDDTLPRGAAPPSTSFRLRAGNTGLTYIAIASMFCDRLSGFRDTFVRQIDERL
jgi:hypothetical protein